jgi:hypothetical protein
MIEATDDATWGWGGPRKVAKLAESGGKVTEAWLAATMPLMMGEDVGVVGLGSFKCVWGGVREGWEL